MELISVNNFSLNLSPFSECKKTVVGSAHGDERVLRNGKEIGLGIEKIPLNENQELKEELEKMAMEMLPQERKLGEFKDKDWIGEAKDFQIGPDIRFAVKSKNSEFLKRIVWGPLTSAEFREVTHRIRELEIKNMESNNILKGNIIDPKKRYNSVSEKPNIHRNISQIKVDMII